MKNTVISEYRSFVRDVDSLCSRVRSQHGDSIVCRKGCSGCCIGISVFPVEWFSLRLHIGRVLKTGGSISVTPDNSCVFLTGDACTVYSARPLICRTHGLPLTYRVEEYDGLGLPVLDSDPERQLVLCELNYRDVDEKSLPELFPPGTTIDMEPLNERLVLLNREFLSTPEGAVFRKFERLPLAAAAAGFRLQNGSAQSDMTAE